MNWITLAVVGAVAAWFEYNYQRSRRHKSDSPASRSAASEAISVANPAAQPSIVPGDQNDKELNTAV